MKTGLIAAAVSSIVVSLAIGVALKSRNDAAHVVAMHRQAEAQERIAAALERAHPEAKDGEVRAGRVFLEGSWRECHDAFLRPVACMGPKAKKVSLRTILPVYPKELRCQP